MSTLAERFAAAVDAVLTLDTPSQIARRILADPVDDGLRSASLDGKVRGGSSESHPERMSQRPERRAGGTHVDDLVAVSRTSTAAVESVLGLVDICLHRSPEADDYGWGDAVKDAHLLVEMDLITAALDVDWDRAAHRVADAFADAVKGYRAVARRWPRDTGRAPSSIVAAWTSGLADEDCCRICLTVEPVGVVRVERMDGRRHGLCRVCYELRRAADGIDPPPALVGVWHDCDRQGRNVAWRTARSRWLESLGVAAS